YRRIRSGDEDVDHHVIDAAKCGDASLGEHERVIESAGAVHRYEADSKDGERDDLPSAVVLDRYHEEHHEANDGQHRPYKVGHAVDWLAERNTKLHDEKLLKQWIDNSRSAGDVSG